MSSFRSGIEELRQEDLAHVGDRRLMEDFEELESVVRALGVERDRRLVEIDRRRTWERDGTCPQPPGWCPGSAWPGRWPRGESAPPWRWTR